MMKFRNLVNFIKSFTHFSNDKDTWQCKQRPKFPTLQNKSYLYLANSLDVACLEVKARGKSMVKGATLSEDIT